MTQDETDKLLVFIQENSYYYIIILNFVIGYFVTRTTVAKKMRLI